MLNFPQRPRAQISSTTQRVAAVVATRDFLLRLTSSKETPRIPREVRREARALLRHFPVAEELRPILEENLQ
jgi:hypothetical protein